MSEMSQTRIQLPHQMIEPETDLSRSTAGKDLELDLLKAHTNYHPNLILGKTAGNIGRSDGGISELSGELRDEHLYSSEIERLKREKEGLQISMRSLHEAKYAELRQQLESQKKAHNEELERLASESRRRQGELATENSRLAGELRDLRLSPPVSPPNYRPQAVDSEPPPYESLQPSASRPDEMYLNYSGCEIRQSDMESIDGMFTANLIQFWMEYLERNELSKFPTSRIVLLRPHESNRLIHPIIRLSPPDKSDLGISNISKDTTHVFAPIFNSSSSIPHWSLLLISLVDNVACHYDFMGSENHSEGLRAVRNLAPALGCVLKFQLLESCPRWQVDESESGVYTVITMRHLLFSRLLTANRKNVVNVEMSGKIIDGPGGRKETRTLIDKIKKENRRRWGA